MADSPTPMPPDRDVTAFYSDNDEKGEQLMPNHVMARTRTGSNKQFETEKCYEEYGFFVGDRVQTPKGPAWVVGIHNGQLYFQIDGDKGASKWTDCKKRDFEQRQFVLLYSPTIAMRNQKRYRAPDLAGLVNSEEFSDVAFLLDDGSKIYAIRGILCKRSEYFRALFKPGHMEAELTEIPLEGVAFAIFLDVLTYLYTGEIQVVERNSHGIEAAIELVKAADLFMLDSLKYTVGNLLCNHVTVDSCIPLLKLADQRSLPRLKETCKAHLLSALKDDSNVGLKDRFKEFVCPENADLVLELTLAQSQGSLAARTARFLHPGVGVGVTASGASKRPHAVLPISPASTIHNAAAALDPDGHFTALPASAAAAGAGAGAAGGRVELALRRAGTNNNTDVLSAPGIVNVGGGFGGRRLRPWAVRRAVYMPAPGASEAVAAAVAVGDTAGAAETVQKPTATQVPDAAITTTAAGARVAQEPNPKRRRIDAPSERDP